MSYINNFETDIIKTSRGDLEITFIGHGSLMFTFSDSTIHIDPYSQLADYSRLPEADLILITHEHSDHLDMNAIDTLSSEQTIVMAPEICVDRITDPTIMKNGDTETFKDLIIEAVPAYNIVHERSSGVPFHSKGVGNGYIINFGDKRIYAAADTEDIPELKELENIECAFLPMNLPYTMTPEMVVRAVKLFSPRILYPYHYGDTDTSKLINLMKDVNSTETRIRSMQ